jgi:L-seryl-tRNA(Ser) seleniumtransferase
VDVVTFSGDKLLGGPQAGIILGNAGIVDRIKKNPMNRAMRIDKFTLAGLESILRCYRDPKTVFETVPTLAMIAAPREVLDRRAKRLARRLRKELGDTCAIAVVDLMSRVGGGAMPEQNLASRGVALAPRSSTVSTLEAALRGREIPVIGRIEDNRLLLDMRTIQDDELVVVARALSEVLAQGGN